MLFRILNSAFLVGKPQYYATFMQIYNVSIANISIFIISFILSPEERLDFLLHIEH